MPELPDIELYLAALRPRVSGRAIERVASPFFVRTVTRPCPRSKGAWTGRCAGWGRLVLELEDWPKTLEEAERARLR